MFGNPFSDQELSVRLDRVRTEMVGRDLDFALLSSPENIFYLTGLDHWGFFAPHLLVVPFDGDMTLISREMERVTIENQVRNALFEGHDNSETAADLAAHHLADAKGRIGVETWSSGHSYGFGAELHAGIQLESWQDITGMVDRLRLVKSLEEQAIMRNAARASDAATNAAIAVIRDGASEAEVAAACLSAMTLGGGTPPGFGPFIRPDRRLGEEHTTWGNGNLTRGDRVFLEIAGCVSRYNAPQGRLVHIGDISDADSAMAENAISAFDAVIGALRPGMPACEVYSAWQSIVDETGLKHYRRHHCGYLVGIGFPPSWTGGNTVTGLRHDSDLIIEEGMSFHILSWLMGTGLGEYFLSNCVLLGQDGAEVLTKTPVGPMVVR